MKNPIPNFVLCAAALFTVTSTWQTARAQRSGSPPSKERLIGRIESGRKTILRGSRNARIEGLSSEGPIDDSTRINGISFRFQPSPEQQSQLDRLLEDQQDPSSPLSHQWLTPEEYADRFGLARSDFEKVREWIAAQGFQVERAARSRSHISFSGTAAQVRAAFGTEVHRYRVEGKTHFANAREVEIPEQLEPLVSSIRGLDDFHEETHAPLVRRANWAGGHGLTPGDLAVIYNVNPVYKAGYNGAGQTILVTGQSLINLQDVRSFRAAAGLPPSDPKLLYLGIDPGYTDAMSEGVLDVEIAGGAAPGANIIYLYGFSANDAAEYGVDENLATVLTHSYGKCEKNVPNWLWFRNVAQQAAAQGITWVASSGDEGVAACDWRAKIGANGVGVNVPASVPEVTAIGGTQFVEGGGNYWSNTAGADGSTALSYIPETAWNETVQAGLVNASTGGYSIAYPRPAWQAGPGVQNYNSRQVPDIAFAASAIHDPYLIFQQGIPMQTGGTSAGTPFFAGVLAVLNQYVVANGIQARPGLGNVNPRLYQLAQTTRGVFHDITTGNNTVACVVGTRDCATGAYGYNAGPGYDPVTGLGSIDVTALFENWAPGKTNPNTASDVTLAVDPTPVVQQDRDADGFSYFFNVMLKETGGAPTTLTGFSIDGNDFSTYIADIFGAANLPAHGTLTSGLKARELNVPSEIVFAASGADNSGQKWNRQIRVPFLAAGSDRSRARMSLSSDPNTVVKIGKGDANCSADFPYGQQLTLRELNGVSVKLTKFLAGGFDYSQQIATWFGSQTLNASGALHAYMCWQLNTVPTTLDYEIDGVDASGRAVQTTLKVDFRSLDVKSGGINIPE
jgi:hypothetical protein